MQVILPMRGRWDYRFCQDMKEVLNPNIMITSCSYFITTRTASLLETKKLVWRFVFLNKLLI